MKEKMNKEKCNETNEWMKQMFFIKIEILEKKILSKKIMKIIKQTYFFPITGVKILI